MACQAPKLQSQRLNIQGGAKHDPEVLHDCSIEETKLKAPDSSLNNNKAKKRRQQKTEKKPVQPDQQKNNMKFLPSQIRLNMAICNAADKSGPEELLNVVMANQAEMSFVNLSTALHKLARLAKDHEGANFPVVLEDARLKILLTRTLSELKHQIHISSTQFVEHLPRCCATIAWAYATLQVRDEVTFSLVSQAVLPRLKELKPMELANLLWSFAQVNIVETSIFAAAEQHVFRLMNEFSLQNLSAIAWAYATVKQTGCTDMVIQVARTFVDGAHNRRVLPFDLATLCWGLASMRLNIDTNVIYRISDIALTTLSKFKPYEFSTIVWAVSILGCRHDELFFSHRKVASVFHEIQESRKPPLHHEHPLVLHEANATW
eukprot:gnl/TRDRNA2_/TRDRNA2_175510_c0_seq14.p1 gnl/TRDRNA2_/TRDRNA2_175510_c0~~gnl/TRDRNA2_/TRDRNA2_175510_c0_seq14.p1  ORF type:complete len:393 (+),score=68.08 gnl/TRDRNA2_/TRDRNA2_175510_c0_seq14:52-1179(+)